MITIKIETENDAFVDNFGNEVARILRKIAKDFEQTDDSKANYNDINGNKVVTIN